MTCDPQFRVLDVVAKWPGSVHDARIFRESNLCTLMEEGMWKFCNKDVLYFLILDTLCMRYFTKYKLKFQ